tara:strand:- start:51 stop:668 length:618 start_codon:yes stop_codon:yes gene_type:complete
MKNLNQIITTVLVILFFGYIFYTYTPIEKTEQSIKVISNNTGIWGGDGIDLSNLDEYPGVAISSQDDLNLITNMMLAYNNMNSNKVISFFIDSCYIIDLNGKEHRIAHKDFETFFNSMDSIKWIPTAIVPLQLTEYRNENLIGKHTAVIVHSAEVRYKKDGSIWHKELVEVFYIADGKIVFVDQYGRDRENFIEEINDMVWHNSN